MTTELRDIAERLTRLERLATRVTRYEGRSSDVIVPVENVSGADLEHGATVVLSDIGTDGVFEVGKPDSDSDMQYLGHVVGKLLAGAIGRCQVAGIAEARRDSSVMSGVAPVTGAHIGPREDSHELGHDQYGARFLCDLYDLGGSVKICLVDLQRTERLVADHRSTFTPGTGWTGHTESTPVYEPVDVLNQTTWFNGLLSDLMSVVPVTSGTKTTYVVSLDTRRDSKHNHGWTKGFVIEEGGTGQDVGWGPLSLIWGLRAPGQSEPDINLTTCQFNSGKNTLLIGYRDDIEAIEEGGRYIYGWMVPHIPSQTWRPAVPIQYELRSIQLDYDYLVRDCAETDHCRLLEDPNRYRKFGDRHITGPQDSSTSLCNYLEWIACNRHDINGIFDLLWYVSCCFSWKVGEMDSNLQSFASSGQALDTLISAMIAWESRVTTILGDATLTTLYGAVTAAYGTMVWYATDHCTKGPCGTEGVTLEYLLECPYWGQQS